MLTGLATQQAVISAHMAEFKGIVFVRGKRPKDGAEKFAQENNLVMLTTDLDMYDACVKIDSITGEDGSGAQRRAILPSFMWREVISPRPAWHPLR